MAEKSKRKVGVWLETHLDGQIRASSLNLLNFVARQKCEIFAFSSRVIRKQSLNHIWSNGAQHLVNCGVDISVYQSPDGHARSLAVNIERYDLDDFVATASQRGCDIVSRCAVILQEPLLHSCVDIDLNSSTATRRIYAGQALSKYSMSGTINFYTLTGDFSPVDKVEQCNQPQIEEVTASVKTDDGSRIVSRKPRKLKNDMLSAKIVCGGGMAFGSLDEFSKLSEFAEEIGASLGATRSAVDAGFMPFSAQIGQTGNHISPDLYFAWGVSGSIFHCAGIKGAKVVVAINKDSRANIFTRSDYGIVEDVFEFLSAFMNVVVQHKNAH